MKIIIGMIMRKRLFFLGGLLISSALLMSCTGGGGGESSTQQYPPWDVPYVPTDCSNQSQKEFVYRILTDVYYWYDKVPKNANLSEFQTPEEVLEKLKYSTLDKWSFIITEEEYQNWFENSQYIGLGFIVKYDENDKFRIAYVFPESPAADAGLERGNTILKINGKTIEEIEQNDLWDEIWGPREVGVVVELEIENNQGEVNTLQLAKDYVKVDPVQKVEVFEINGTKIGYLLFMSYRTLAKDQLIEAFNTFKNENVTRLIVDLRYNPGGSSEISDLLDSLITGLSTDKVFSKLIHNDRYKDYNFNIYFYSVDNPLGLKKVIFLTTGRTCSASELTINALKPYIKVITVGETTCGKPVGMYFYHFCQKVLVPITFEVLNAKGEGGYFDGLKPTCSAIDNLTVPLGDTRENMLAEAIYYINNENCSSIETKKFFGERKEVPLRGFYQFIGAF